MPVLDHEIHESVRVGSDHRYGCWNRQAFATTYNAPVGMSLITKFNALIKTKPVIHRMSTECRYDMSLTDLACTDCRHRGSGEAYDRKIREAGK